MDIKNSIPGLFSLSHIISTVYM